MSDGHGPASGEWRSYGQLYFARLASVAAGVLLTVLSARALQPRGRGEFAALATAATVAVQVLNLGMSSSLVVLFSRRPRRIARYSWALWLIPLGTAVLVSALGLLGLQLAPASPLARLWPLLTLWIPVQLLGLHQSAALMAMGGARVLARIEMAGRAMSVGLGASALAVFPGSVPAFAAALLAGDALVAALQTRHLGWPWAPREARNSARAFMSAALRLGLKAYPLLFLPYLLIKSDILIVRWLRGAAETGVYSVASQGIDMLLLLPTTIAAVALPSIVQARKPAGEFVRVLRPTLLISLGLAVGVAAVGYWLIVLVLGRPYAGAYPALLLLLPGFLCLAVQSLLSQYFAARGFPLVLSVYWLAGLVANAALNVLFVPRFGYLAASVSSSVTYALVLLLMLWHFRGEVRAGHGNARDPGGADTAGGIDGRAARVGAKP